MASVDVVVPCYRYGALLPTAVRSVLDQPGVEVRVLVIDDASGDGSADVARALAKLDDRVEVIEHEQNRGHIATYNEGLLDWAKADYSVLLSADDALTPGALARAAALLDAHPEVGFAYGRPIHWDGSDPLPPARTEPAGWMIYPGRPWVRRRFLLGNGCITCPEVVVRTSLQQQLGGYDPRLPHTGDIEMWMRFALHSDVGYLRGVDQAYYRVHGANMSTLYYGEAGIRDLHQRLAAYEALLERCGDRLPDASRLERRLRRTLAKEALLRAARAYDKGRAETEPIEAMVSFARQAYGDDLMRLPAWHALGLRRRLGPRRAAALRPFVLTAAGRRLKWRLRHERWKRQGI
jgi:glycosyltransferase involved in cell wall biosynthesis